MITKIGNDPVYPRPSIFTDPGFTVDDTAHRIGGYASETRHIVDGRFS
jgi:hypothetical protein